MRYIAIIAAALIICAGLALAAAGPAALWPFLTLVALLLAAFAAVLAAYLFLKAERMQGDIDRLAHTLDGALKELAAGNERNSLTLGALTATIDRQIGGMLDRIDTHSDAPTEAAAAPPAENRDDPAGQGAGERKPAAKPALGATLPAGWADRELELSLEPIVSVSQGAAAGFEVLAHLVLEDGTERIVRGLSPAIAPADLAAFELALVKAAMHASRRQLGADSSRLPLHVAVSAAMLGDAAALEEVCGLLDLHAGLARGLIFSIPAELFTTKDKPVQHSIVRLAVSGAALAAEGWPTEENGLERLKLQGVRIVKLAADRLLDRERVRRKAVPGADLAELIGRSGMTIVATDVATDEDAVALLDLGVDLMRGECFSPPRKLKSSPPGGSATLPAR
ncbi:EAL domain-containing protein [Mesorhizobium australicum]|uniref:EAL domain, c-di-GMP-specific phosphodiesterase class I (Or its enzymatically inactive variant) n=1 Tax=Mesorhizobium australicum TaxID=536018 RepID=A0A1X7NPU1_9HYPH|nr:EAL domain-containing protein [Mesorhizobium australicum]SMH39984.1 EAL domain, c-di-GMP-specific phosphodiesterase class I (or its enzymatically inactive variant) [Mesorhizobium australicum]